MDIGNLGLGRNVGESITVTVPPSSEPTTVVFTITKIDGKKVGTVTTAPKNVHIRRSELDSFA
jgi:sRNA-binding carbon storage regulator CsrA